MDGRIGSFAASDLVLTNEFPPDNSIFQVEEIETVGIEPTDTHNLVNSYVQIIEIFRRGKRIGSDCPVPCLSRDIHEC